MQRFDEETLECQLQHVYKESSRVADFMAKLSLKQENRYLLKWKNPSGGTGEILNQDEIERKWPKKSRLICKT